MIRGFVQYLDAGIAQPGEHLVQVAGAKVHCVERTLGEHHPHGVEVARRTLHIVAEHHIDARLVRSADLRYDGQAYEVRVDAPAGAVDGSFQATVVESFHTAHEQLYGYCYRGMDRHDVEWVNLRVTGIGPIERPVRAPRPNGDGKIARARTGQRPVFFEAWEQSVVFDRGRLEPGDLVAGPAVIEEFGSTVPIHPGYVARVDPHLNLVVSRA